MRITSLSLQGFKSFGDRVRLDFAPGITAVVGPNGSGKSNLIDALRWATGGGRAREFRAGDKTELIFHGAAGKRRVGYAEVEVEFSLPRGALKLQRSLDRDGVSKLWLNGRAARFLDVDDVLAGSGLGRGSLAVIGQGEVSQVLMADPARLLGYVAEAADVARLSGRREQTGARLATARDHLERLADLVAELELQLERLGREAEQAERHDRLSRDALQLGYTAARRRRDSLAGDIAELAREEAELDRTIAAGRAELAAGRRALDEIRAEVASQEEAYRSAVAEAETLRGDLRVADERLSASATRLDELRAQLEGLDGEWRALRELAEPVAASDDVEELTSRLEAQEAELDELQRELERQEAERRERLFERDALKAELDEAARALAAHESRLAELDRQERASREQLAALAAEGAPDDLATLGAALELAGERERAATRTLASARQAALEAQQAHASAEAEAQSRERSAERSRRAHEARRGYAEGPRNALRSGVDGVLGSVADLLRVGEPYREALASALGRRAEYVVVDRAATAAAVLEKVRAAGGWVTLLPLELLRARRATLPTAVADAAGVIGLAADLVDTDERFEVLKHQLLGSTTLVADLDQAVGLARRLRRRPRFVTMAGDLLEASGAMSGGRRNPQAWVLGAAADLEQADEEARAALEQATATRSALGAAQARLRRADADAAEAAEARGRARSALAEAQASLAATSRLRLDLEARLADLEARRRGLTRPEAPADASRLDELDRALTRAEAALVELRAAVDDKRGDHLALRGAVGVARERRLSHARALEEYRRAQERLSRIARQRAERVQAVALATDAHDRARRGREVALAALPRDLEAKEAAYREIQRRARDAEGELQRLTEEQAARGEALERCRVVLARRETARELADADLAGFPAGLEPLELPERAARSRLNAVRSELEALGAVNHRAGQEVAQQQARHDELVRDSREAAAAVEELGATLERLEAETTGRLNAAVERLEEGFGRHVEELFGASAEGGISVEREGRRPVGLSIRLRPPGKQTESLNLLSVGERTMGALAFLFALMNPGGEGGLPVAVLDEVDAPLDEANIRRYTGFLERLAARGTQFVLITHQKTTFEVADVLVGVTTDLGVSRIFSIGKDEVAPAL